MIIKLTCGTCLTFKDWPDEKYTAFQKFLSHNINEFIVIEDHLVNVEHIIYFHRIEEAE